MRITMPYKHLLLFFIIIASFSSLTFAQEHLPISAPLIQQQQEELIHELFQAIQINDKQKIQSLLDRGLDINIQNEKLMNAICKGDIEACQLLIANGSNVTLQDHNGQTALMLAAIWGYRE